MRRTSRPHHHHFNGPIIPTRFIGEQHVKEDLGWIPSLKDWFENIQIKPWMLRVALRPEHLDKSAKRPNAQHKSRRTAGR